MISKTSERKVRLRDMPLHFKLMLPVTLVNCLITLALFLAVWQYSTAQLESRLVDDANLVSHTVRSAARSIPDKVELSTLLATIGEESRINFIAIADPVSQRVITASDETTRRMPEVVIPFWAAFTGRGNSGEPSDLPWFHFSKHQLQYVSPTFSGVNNAIGTDFVLLIAMDTSKARNEVLSGARDFAVSLLLCLITLGASTVWLLKVIVVRRVKKITQATPNSPQDLLTYEPPLEGLDELSRLSRTLARAYSSLGNSFVQLEHHAKQLELLSEQAEIGIWRLVISDTEFNHMAILLSEQTYKMLGIAMGSAVRVGGFANQFTEESREIFHSELSARRLDGKAFSIEVGLCGEARLGRRLVISGLPCIENGITSAIEGTIQWTRTAKWQDANGQSNAAGFATGSTAPPLPPANVFPPSLETSPETSAN